MVVCDGRAVVYHVILALTRNKTQRNVQRQLRFDKGVAKGCSLQVKRCLRSVFKACSAVMGVSGGCALVVVCDGRAVVYHGNYLR